MISIALKEANRVAKISVDRRYHTLIQQRPQLLTATKASMVVTVSKTS